MILIQLHSIKVGAQEYHEKWNHTQIHTWAASAWSQEGKYDEAPKE